MNPLKRLERIGRRALVAGMSRLLAVVPRPVVLPAAPRILVIRLDERLGNLLLLTPLLHNLRRVYPNAHLALLAQARGAQILATHPALNQFIPFNKRTVFGAAGPFATLWRLRRARYDLCIDAANTTDPSTTQALLTRFSGARHTVGSDQAGFGRFYSAPVAPPAQPEHEIDLRLRLLSVLPGFADHPATRHLSLGTLRAPGPHVQACLGRLGSRRFAVLNIGARLHNKQLSVTDYVCIAALLDGVGLIPVLTWGPAELPLAEAVAHHAPRACLAPPTTVADLAALMGQAVAVVSCDTGPMHLAVAMGTPTCGIFISTDPRRFGYDTDPHRAIDTAGEESRQDWLQQVYSWVVHLPIPRLVASRSAG